MAIPGLYFFIFVFSIQLTINKWSMQLDSNHGPLISEATALPTEPQPLPQNMTKVQLKLKSYFMCIWQMLFSYIRLNTLFSATRFPLKFWVNYFYDICKFGKSYFTLQRIVLFLHSLKYTFQCNAIFIEIWGQPFCNDSCRRQI